MLRSQIRDQALIVSSRRSSDLKSASGKTVMKLRYVSCFACICWMALASVTFSQEVAVTIDDLPSHGALPPGMTRADVAKSILETLRQAHVPKVYGFINAKRLEEHPEDVEVLKLWRGAGFPLGNHTYAHLSINTSSVEEFEQNVAA